jgi:hypothetical protein
MRIIHAPGSQASQARTHGMAARRHAAGEHLVWQALAAALDDSYALVQGLRLPGGASTIDAVLIGRRILAIEVATIVEPRVLLVQGMAWRYRDGDAWHDLDDNPSRRAESGAKRVSYALRSAGLPAYGVAPVVALVGGADCTVDRSRVPVKRPSELAALARSGSPVAQPAWPDLALRALLVAASAELYVCAPAPLRAMRRIP